MNIELREQIEVRFNEVESLLRSLPGGAAQAGSRALNRAAVSGRAAAIQKAKERYYINEPSLRKGMKIRKATKNMLFAKITSKSTRRELIDFEVRPKEIIRGAKLDQLKVAVKRDGGVRTIPRAFVERGTGSGRIHVLQRTSGARYPLQVKYGPAPSEMLSSNDVIPYVEEKAGEMLLKRLEQEINYMLER